MVGFAMVSETGVVAVRALPGTQPSQYRRIPLRAESVKTVLVWSNRVLEICWSHSTKKKVLFLMIGPPMLTVYWCVFLQSGCVGFQHGGVCPLILHPVRGVPTSLLLFHVLGFSPVFWTFQTALPLNLFVPDRVVIWICELPLPNSASTGDRISLI